MPRLHQRFPRTRLGRTCGAVNGARSRWAASVTILATAAATMVAAGPAAAAVVGNAGASPQTIRSTSSSDTGSSRPTAAFLATATTTSGTTTAARYPRFGLAVPGGDPEGFEVAADAGLQSTWARLYAGGSVPTSLAAWPNANAAARAGHRLWLSLALDVDALKSGALDAQLAHFVKTLPAGTRLTTNHEPSNRTKHISPAMFAAAWNHAAIVIRNASAGQVLTGPIEIQANVIKGGYLTGLNKSLVKFVGLDGYDGISGPQFATRSFQDVVGAAYAYTVKEFPHTRIGFAEFNSSRTTGWARWVAAAMSWAKSVGADTAVLFTALDAWRESPKRLRTLADRLTRV